MVDLPTATQLLVLGDRQRLRPGSGRRTLLTEGVVHVDYDDPEHVFLVTVSQVPRVHLPTGAPRVAELGGVEVRLVDVELANHVSIVLTGTGPVADQQARQHAAAFDAWAATAADGRDDDRPEWPASRLLDVRYTVTDDVGTVYRLASGEAGGDDHPWRSVWRHLPTPPPDARQLRVVFAGGPVVELPLPAW